MEVRSQWPVVGYLGIYSHLLSSAPLGTPTFRHILSPKLPNSTLHPALAGKLVQHPVQVLHLLQGVLARGQLGHRLPHPHEPIVGLDEEAEPVLVVRHLVRLDPPASREKWLLSPAI